MLRSYRRLALLAVTVVVATNGGCARYAARPVVLNEIASAQDQRFLDRALIAREVTRLAPAAPIDPLRWDRLTLFAALIRSNPDVRTARAAIDSAVASARAARAGAGITLTLTSEYAGAAPESSPWLFGGALDIPIDRGGRRKARLDVADLGILIARYNYAEAVWTARVEMRRALAAQLIADRQVDVTTVLRALRQRQFDAMERRVNAGEASRGELERVRVDLADADRRLRDAALQVDGATASLATVLGVRASALDGIALIWEGFDVAAAASTAVSAKERMAAITGRADILKGAASYDQSEADLRGEIAKQRPAFSIGPGFTWERGLVKLPFSLGLSLPSFDLNRRAIAAAEVRRVEAGVRIEALVAAAGSAIDAAMIEVRAAHATLAAVRTGELAIATRLARRADNEIRAGAIDRTEWAAAQAGAQTARLSEIDALARVHAADAGLEDALRRPREGPELMITSAALR